MNPLSPFSAFLNTNYIPSDREMGAIKSLVEDREAIASALANQIQEARQTLATLEERYATHRKFIDDHTMLLSPIRRCPLDVLTLVFLMCRDAMQQPQYPGNYIRRGTSNSHVCVVISHVCSGWRRLALRTPSLWSQIHIELPTLGDPRENNAVAYAYWCMRMSALHSSVSTWISRASSAPITLKLTSGSAETTVDLGYRAEAKAVYEEFVEMLRGSRARWSGVNCTLWADPMTIRLAKLFDGTREEYPILTKLYITIVNDGTYDECTAGVAAELTPADIFAAPCLRDVSVLGIWGDIPAAKSNCHRNPPIYESITRFKFEGRVFDGQPFSGQQAASLLRALPNLVSVNFLLTDPGTDMPRTSPTSLPDLVTMTLQYSPAPNGFASSLDLPRLTSVHLYCDWPSRAQRNQDSNGNVELILKYGRQLKELTLSRHAIPLKALSACLEQLCRVTRLRVSGMQSVRPSSDSDLSLISDLTKPGILPLLEDLTLSDISNFQSDGATESAVRELLIQRLRMASDVCISGPRPPVRKARVHFLCERKVDILEEMGERGLSNDADICLIYPSPSGYSDDNSVSSLSSG